MYRTYAVLSALAEPLVPWWLRYRLLKGKEDGARLSERLGKAALPRPKGPLVWIHAASVGESISVLPLIERLCAGYPHLALLLTTGTRTSAQLMKARLQKTVIHQYAPVDTPGATARFMKHWRPDIALFVESELWPNLVRAADRWQCFMAVINGRMSQRSFAFWRKYPGFITAMLSCFDLVLAQSETDKERFVQLGAKRASAVGNLKYDAAPLPCDESQLIALKSALGSRPVWLAASTHPGEEGIVEKTHAALAAARPNLLTIIVPRHPDRGAMIAAELQKRFTIGIRSRGDTIAPNMQFYIGDTLGELGLFYRLSDIVFMGGSLVAHGGQNPLEPARLACAIVTGPHTHNFGDIYRDLAQVNACARVHDAKSLTKQLDALLRRDDAAQALQSAAQRFVAAQSGATDRLLAELHPVLGN